MLHKTTLGVTTTCSHCDAGRFQETPGQQTCRQCPTGYSQQATGIPYCVGCIPGQYQDQPGKHKCKNCTKDTASSIAQRTSPCDACGAGRTAPTGSIACSECLAGKYSTTDAIATPICSICLPGQYTNASNMKTCFQCPLGYAQSLSGQTSCTPCDAGTYGVGCKQCPLGYARRSADDATHCHQCEFGETTTTLASTTCDKCEEGHFGYARGTCSMCPFGYYQDAKGQLDCTDTCLTAGKVPNQKRTGCELPPWGACKVGIEYLYDKENKTQWECRKCPNGAHCDANAVPPHYTHLKPKDGFWPVPKQMNPMEQQPFIKCLWPDDCDHGATSENSSCVGGVGTKEGVHCPCQRHTRGILCSTCIPGFTRAGNGLCGKCRDAELPIRMALLASFVFIVVYLIMRARRHLLKLQKRYGRAWRDAALATTIIINFVSARVACLNIVNFYSLFADLFFNAFV